jgi:mRNA interferase MazF
VKRGDIVTVSLGGDLGKLRPALVVQSDLAPATYRTVTVLPLTSHLELAPLFRITVEPSRTNGLRKISQVMVDKPMTHLREKLGAPVGRLDDDNLVRVNRALALWLGLAG